MPRRLCISFNLGGALGVVVSPSRRQFAAARFGALQAHPGQDAGKKIGSRATRAPNNPRARAGWFGKGSFRGLEKEIRFQEVPLARSPGCAPFCGQGDQKQSAGDERQTESYCGWRISCVETRPFVVTREFQATLSGLDWFERVFGFCRLGPPARCPFSALFWLGGFPTKIERSKKGILILTSLLEDLAWETIVCWYLQENRPSGLRWEMDFVHPEY